MLEKVKTSSVYMNIKTRNQYSKKHCFCSCDTIIYSEVQGSFQQRCSISNQVSV